MPPKETSPKEPSTVASQRVADILAARILAGDLKPGDRIKQDELADELEMSRIPVRDALRILETRGLVSLKPNAGARVTSLTTKDIEVSYHIRGMLEPHLLADSMPHLTAQDIDHLRAVKDRLNAAEAVDEYMPLLREFHWTAFSRHEAPLLAQIVERLWDATQPYRRVYAELTLKNAERSATMRAERDLLFSAIAAGEAELAPRILATHIKRSQNSLTEYLKAKTSC